MEARKHPYLPWLWIVSLILAIISFSYWYIIGPQDFDYITHVNTSLLEARSLSEGKITLPDRALDTALYNERILNVFQPGQTLYLLTHDLIFGKEAVKWVQIEVFLVFVISVFLFGLAVLSLSRGRVIFAVALAVSTMFGVPYISCLRPALRGMVWQINQCVSFLFVAAALALIAMRKLTARTLLLVGLCIAGATVHRQQFILLLLLPIAMLFQDPDGESWQIRRKFSDRKEIRALAKKNLCLLVFPIFAVAIIIGFQMARFGRPFENGYTYLFEGRSDYLAKRVNEHGLMSLHYLPENLYRIFWASPKMEYEGWRVTELEGDPRGNSLLFAQPILLMGLMLWPSIRTARVQSFAAIALLQALPVWLYHGIAYYAPGSPRASLDYLPLWIATIALAARYYPAAKRVLWFSVPLAATAVWYGYKLLATTSF